MGEPPQPVVERKKRGRPKKLVCPLSVEEEPVESSGTKKMGRPRKVVTLEPTETEMMSNEVIEHDPLPEEVKSSSSAKIVKKRNRDQPDKSLWGRIVGNVPRDIMPSQRLPTNRVVMQRYHTMRAMSNNRTTLNDDANMLYEEILPIWKRANICTVERKTCIERLVLLLKSWKGKYIRDMTEGSEEEKTYIDMLNSVFMMTWHDLEKVKELKVERRQIAQQRATK